MAERISVEKAEQYMLLLGALDEDVTIHFSEYTGQWYANIHVEIGGDGLLSSPVHHTDSPTQAIAEVMAELTTLPHDKYIVLHSPRRHYRWNGATFKQIPLPSHFTKEDTDA